MGEDGLMRLQVEAARGAWEDGYRFLIHRLNAVASKRGFKKLIQVKPAKESDSSPRTWQLIVQRLAGQLPNLRLLDNTIPLADKCDFWTLGYINYDPQKDDPKRCSGTSGAKNAPPIKSLQDYVRLSVQFEEIKFILRHLFRYSRGRKPRLGKEEREAWGNYEWKTRIKKPVEAHAKQMRKWFRELLHRACTKRSKPDRRTPENKELDRKIQLFLDEGLATKLIAKKVKVEEATLRKRISRHGLKARE